MIKQKSIKKNMIFSIILTASNFIFPLITFSYVSKILTPVGTGKVAFVNSILTYFSYIAIIGIPAYGMRECAKIRDDKEKLSKVVAELFTINMISTLVAYILLFLTIILVPKINEYSSLFLVMSISILLTTLGVEWLYNALEEYKYITIRSLLFKIISVILTFLLINSKDDYLIYAFLTIFTTSMSYICNFVYARKFISFKQIKRLELKKHLKPIFILFFASIIITIYSNFDISMIGFISSEYQVGLYNAALKIKTILLSLSTAVTSVIVPRIVYYINKDENQVEELVKTSFRTSLLLSFSTTIFCFIFTNDIIIFLCGADYLGAISTLKVLLICILPLILTNLFGIQLLIPHGLEKRFSQSVFIGLFINLFLNILLIPKYGSYGAAIGTLITEIWNVFWMSTGIKKYIKTLFKINYFPYIVSYVISGVISYFASLLFDDNFIKLFACASTYYLTCFIILYIMKEPIVTKQINRIIKKFKIKKMR